LSSNSQFCSQFHALVRVHLQQPNRGPANAAAANNPIALKCEMATPAIQPRVEKPHSQTGIGIYTRKVGSFEKAAPLTCPGEIH